MHTASCLHVQQWAGRPACQGRGTPLDPEFWFPEPGDTIPAGVLSLCAGCPVRCQCLATALDRHERHGVWAGLTACELDQLTEWIADGEALDAVLEDALAIAAGRPADGQRVDYWPAHEDEAADDAAGWLDAA